MNTLDTFWQDALRKAGVAPEWVERGREASRCRLLIVADEGFDFSRSGPRGLGRLLDTLSRSGPPDGRPVLRLASRGACAGMPLNHDGLSLDVEQHFDFAWADPPLTTEHVDQVWCFCSEVGRPLSADEQAALALYSQSGGGVLVTGTQGSWPLARHWPRVQRMQRWNRSDVQSPSVRPQERLVLATVAPQFRLMTDTSGSWQWRPHELLMFEPRLLTKAVARNASAEWISTLPEWAMDERSTTAPRGPDPAEPSDVDTVARACLQAPLGVPTVSITAIDGTLDAVRAGTRTGRVVCDATAAHFTHAEPQGLERRTGSGAGAPADDAQWTQVRLQTTAYVLNVLHWLQPLPRQCLRLMWDLVMLRFHPRLALMACDTPAARQALGAEAHALWQEWRGCRSQSWMSVLSCTAGVEPAEGTAFWSEEETQALGPARDRALGEALAYLRRSVPAGAADRVLAPEHFDPVALLAALNAAVRVGLTPPAVVRRSDAPPTRPAKAHPARTRAATSKAGRAEPLTRPWRPRWPRWIAQLAHVLHMPVPALGTHRVAARL